jgi:hypothetical protein
MAEGRNLELERDFEEGLRNKMLPMLGRPHYYKKNEVHENEEMETEISM